MGYVEEILAGHLVHRHHLLPRVLGAVSLWWGEALGLSPWTATAASCAVGGALISALLWALVHRTTASPWLATLAATLAAVAAAPWRMSTTFEVHIWPVAALLGCALLVCAACGGRGVHPLGRATRLAAAAGAVQGLAVTLHLIAAPVAAVWVVALALSERPWRVRLAQVLAFLAAAAVVLEVLYLGARLVDPSLVHATPVGLVFEDLRAAPRDAPVPITLADLASAARNAWVLPGRLDGLAEGVGLVLALAALALGLGRARALWRGWRGLALAPLLWPLAVLPLTAVDAANWEYWTGAVLAWTWLGALVLSEALAAGGRWRRAAQVTAGMAVLWVAVLAVHGARAGGSPVGVPVGVVHHEAGLVELLDGRGGRWLWREGSEPLRLPGSRPAREFSTAAP